MRDKFARVTGWLSHHPWIGTAFFVGVGAGLLLCLPLFPIELPDGVGDVLGALIGAFIAVGASAWLVDHKERRLLIDARAFLRRNFAPLLEALEDATNDLHRYVPSREPDLRELDRRTAMGVKFGVLETRVNELKAHHDAIRQVFVATGVFGHVAFSDVRHALDAILEVAVPFRQQAVVAFGHPERNAQCHEALVRARRAIVSSLKLRRDEALV